MGFTRKGNAKTVLDKHFTIETDYQLKKLASAAAEASFENQHGGQNKENILLTVNTFNL